MNNKTGADDFTVDVLFIPKDVSLNRAEIVKIWSLVLVLGYAI